MQLLPRPQRNIEVPEKLDYAHKAPKPAWLEVARRADLSLETDYEPEKIIIFIDGSSLFYAASNLALNIDYRKLLLQLTGKRRLVRAYFYTTVDPENQKQQNFLLWMQRNGYRVITKDLTKESDPTQKATLNVNMAVDMYSLAKCCDTMVVLSGNGDLSYALNRIAYRGVYLELVSLRSMTSDRLLNVVDRYTDLEELKEKIEKDQAAVNENQGNCHV
ncbi:MAG: NYN domain-containing protein [Cyanobacteria bacterium J083]|nr:MAG: NYN domain-containing protein [Cyanobacteria bacterium J083]